MSPVRSSQKWHVTDFVISHLFFLIEKQHEQEKPADRYCLQHSWRWHRLSFCDRAPEAGICVRHWLRTHDDSMHLLRNTHTLITQLQDPRKSTLCTRAEVWHPVNPFTWLLAARLGTSTSSLIQPHFSSDTDGKTAWGISFLPCCVWCSPATPSNSNSSREVGLEEIDISTFGLNHGFVSGKQNNKSVFKTTTYYKYWTSYFRSRSAVLEQDKILLPGTSAGVHLLRIYSDIPHPSSIPRRARVKNEQYHHVEIGWSQTRGDTETSVSRKIFKLCQTTVQLWTAATINYCASFFLLVKSDDWPEQ